MPAFKSEDAFRRFAHSVKWSMRYAVAGDAAEFLESLKEEAMSRTEVVPNGTRLWRAQLGHDWAPIDYDDDEPLMVASPLPIGRMKPLRERATEGRANPKGIPYLYVSTHRETALAEVRPWVGSFVSVAGLLTIRELRVVNCTEDARRKLFFDGAPPQYWDSNVWCDIDSAFSEPVTPTDDEADYAPTQIMAEVFKAKGFDGVAYRSALGDGHNMALFDVDAAAVEGCSLFQVKKIDFDFGVAGDSYVVADAETDGG